MAFVVSAVTAVGAIVAAETVTAAMVLTAMSTVGAAMTVVGAVTGSKELVKIGGVLGVVGGVGGLVNGAMSGAAAGAAEGAGVAEGATAAEGSDVAGELYQQGAGAAASDAAGNGMVQAGASDLGATTASIGGPAQSSSMDAFLRPENFGATQPSIDAGMYETNTSMADSASTMSQNGLPSPDFASSVRPLGYTPTTELGQTYGTAQSTLDQIKTSVGKAWDGMSPMGKAEIVKSILAMPGGIQNQKNSESALAIQQQKVNQTAYASKVPTFGIIGSAQKG